MPRVLFLGVSTSASSVHRVFPGWARAFGMALELEGVDLPVGAPAAAYLSLVRRFRDDPFIAGMVVTTHKASLWDACHALFDRVTAAAAMLHEVGGVSRAEGLMAADAPDVRSVGRVAEQLLSDERWTNGPRHALILGAGGAGLSLAYNLSGGGPATVAERVVLTEIDPARVGSVRDTVAGWRGGGVVEVHVAGRGVNDRLVAAAESGTLIVNATGVGKDRPGSPLAADTPLPMRSIYWDFNYRGDLQLLRRARAQAPARDLLVVDGRDYLVNGWMEALCFVLGRQPTTELLARFEGAARAAGISGGGPA